MTAKNKKGRRTANYLPLLAGVILVLTLPLLFSYTVGPNYRNVSVDTTVNVTQSLPEVLSVSINDGASNLTLTAGSTFNVYCNSTIRDYNGGGTLAGVNATLYYQPTSSQSAPDDNNDHYTNETCTEYAVNGYYANYTCSFDVYYYANNGTWVCNVTALDSYDFNGSDDAWNHNTTIFDPLLALNVTNPIDYGELAVGDTSPSMSANVSNFGNRDINITVYGYGSTPNDDLAMVCSQGNISIDNERYDTTEATLWSAMTALTASPVMVGNWTLAQQTNDSLTVVNNTYWRLFVPPNPFGRCNGTVVFQAEDAQ